MTVSDEEFINDVSIFQDQNPSDYYWLKIVTRPLDDTINGPTYEKIFDDCPEAEIKYNEFVAFKKKLTASKKTWKILKDNLKTHFTIRFCTQQFLNWTKRKNLSRTKMK